MAPRSDTNASLQGVPRRLPRRVSPSNIAAHDDYRSRALQHVWCFPLFFVDVDFAVVAVVDTAAAAALIMRMPRHGPYMQSKLIASPKASHYIENVRDLA